MPGGALHLIELGALEDVARDLRAALRPRRRRGQVGLRVGPLTSAADRARGAPGGHRRPHLAPAPDRRPDLRAGQGHHRAARRCSRAASTRAPGSAWSWGIVHAGAAANVIPRPRAGRRHRPDPRRGGLGRLRDAGPRARRTRSSRRTASRPTSTYQQRRARRSSTSRSRTGCWPARSSGARATPAGCRPHAEPRRRGLRRGTSTGSPAPWAGSAPARPAARRTTCTRATCASTSARSAIGARVLANAAVGALVTDR